MTFVITTCTNRKRKLVPGDLHASSLPSGSLADLVEMWCARVSAADVTHRAGDLYGGRGFREAAGVAERLKASLLIVSGGLGLIRHDTAVPSYACTVIAGAEDSIAHRLTDGSSAADWWRAICVAVPASGRISDAFGGDGDQLVLAALSDAYLGLVAAEVEALPAASQRRLRLFTRAPLQRISSSLKSFVMPYDDRLDGPNSPIRGTRSDFASRALRHFADHILAGSEDHRDAGEHSYAVIAALANWSYPNRPERARHDDQTLLRLISEHWDSLKGSSSKLLPFFRHELNVACEQGRFASLVREFRSTRA